MHLLCCVCLIWASTSESRCTDANREDCAGSSSSNALLQVSSRAELHDSSLSAAAAWQDREFHLVPHHKTGTVMTHEAAENMMLAGLNATSEQLPNGVREEDVVEATYSDTLEEIVSPSDLPVPWIEASMNGMGMATTTSMMETSASPKCIAHISRNPFEVIASGYIYHKAGSEAWLGVSFDDAGKDCHWEYYMPIKQAVPDEQKSCFGTYCKSMAQIMHSSHSGSLADFLPDASPSESYSDYLNRVNLTEGLIAESLWVVNSTFAPMRFVHDYAADHPCSTNVCLSEFSDDCLSSWQRILSAWEMPEPQYSILLEGAMKSCPRTSQQARDHSSASIAEESNVAHEPEHEMVTLLRELDRLHFNGRIAAFEEHLGCPVSGKYKELSEDVAS